MKSSVVMIAAAMAAWISATGAEFRVEKDSATGLATYYDESGKLLLKELGRTSNEVVLDSPEGEKLYGLGQFQDGALEIRNLPRTLIQVNTQASVPLLHSTRGWSILFNTARRIDFNPCDDEIALTPTGQERTLPNGNGDNGLYGIYLKEIEMEGEIVASEDGEYAFMLDAGTLPKEIAKRHIVEIDSKTILEERNFQLPPNRGFKVNLTKGFHKVKIWRGVKDKPSLKFRKCSNKTVVRVEGADKIDFTFFAGTIPENIAAYRKTTGGTAALPDWSFGYWHCRERYHSQNELLENLREFKRRGIPVSVIVQDWQWWKDKTWNSMEWDPNRFPDPKAMIEEIHSLGSKFMLSVWSKTEGKTPFANEIRAANGFVQGSDVWMDFTKRDTVDVWLKWMKKNIVSAGVDAWWFDAVEPEDDALHGKKLSIGDGDEYRNSYPLWVNEAYYRNLPQKDYLALTRCFFTGQNRLPCVLWSGDVGGTWSDLRKQVAAGLGASLSGVPWWTSDAGGFFRPKNQYTNEEYKRLMVRWFEFATFCGVQRIHGFMSETEPWRYGEQTERILRKYIDLRQKLMPYILDCAKGVAAKNEVLMRPLIMDFADDTRAAENETEFMFGPRYLVAPVLEDTDKAEIYLPKGAKWRNFWTGEVFEGGNTIRVDAPLDKIPLFERIDSAQMLFNMVHHNPGEERWVTEFTEPHHLKDLGYTGQILAYGAQCGLTFDDFEENIVPRHSTERAWIEHHAFECRKYFDKARKVGLGEYPWIDVLVVPKSLMAKYGDEMKGADGKLSILKPMTERVVRAQLAEFFKLYPGIEGITIRFGETYLHDTPFHVGGSPVHTPDEHARLMNILRDEVCVKRGKMVIYRLWDFAQFHTKPQLYLPAANQVEPHEKFLVAFKHCNFDFMRTYPMNANIGLGKHGQIIELSLNQGGCYGKNAYPYYLGKGLIDGFRDDVEGPWRHGKCDIKGLKDIKDWSIVKGYWIWNWGDGWKGPYFSNEFWMRLNETVLRRWIFATKNAKIAKTEEDVFMEYAKGDLGLSEEDAAKFRKMCLLSEDAGYYGYHSDVGNIDDWWLRDNYFRAVKLDGFVKDGTLEALYKEKRDNLARWDEIVRLADEIKFPNEEDGHFVRVSSRYGMYKHKIAEIIIRAQGFLAAHETDKAKAATLVKEFEDTWSAWEKLRRENPDCPTLYEYESFEFNYSEPLFGKSLKKLKGICK